MKEPIGIKQIAKLAEVSIGTVDRVLHNRGGVSKITEQKYLMLSEKRLPEEYGGKPSSVGNSQKGEDRLSRPGSGKPLEILAVSQKGYGQGSRRTLRSRHRTFLFLFFRAICIP